MADCYADAKNGVALQCEGCSVISLNSVTLGLGHEIKKIAADGN